MSSYEIIFNNLSAAELSKLPKMLQMEVFSDFNITPDELDDTKSSKFGFLHRDNRKLYRYRTKEYRIYFEKTKRGLLIHRILHKNTLKDFIFRSNLPLAEDEVLQKNPEFWKLIDAHKEKNSEPS